MWKVPVPPEADGNVVRQYGRVLSRLFDGELIEKTTGNPHQAASESGATLLITPVGFRAFGDMSDLVRRTTLPTLFVPGSHSGPEAARKE